MWGKGRLFFLYMFFCGVEWFYKVDEEVLPLWDLRDWYGKLLSKYQEHFSCQALSAGDLEKNENLFLRRDTPSTQKVQESPECSEAIRIEAEARGVSITWKDFSTKTCLWKSRSYLKKKNCFQFSQAVIPGSMRMDPIGPHGYIDTSEMRFLKENVILK